MKKGLEYLDKLSEDEFHYTQEFYERDRRKYLLEREIEFLISRINHLESMLYRMERILYKEGRLR